MPLSVHWFLPTAGDGREVAGFGPAGARRPAGRVLQEAVRRGAEVGRLFPPKLWRVASSPLLRVLRGGRTRVRPELDPDDRRQLVAWFADDVRLLEQLTGESFDDWLITDRTGGAFTVRRSAGAERAETASG